MQFLALSKAVQDFPGWWLGGWLKIRLKFSTAGAWVFLGLVIRSEKSTESEMSALDKFRT